MPFARKGDAAARGWQHVFVVGQDDAVANVISPSNDDSVAMFAEVDDSKYD